MKNLYAIRTVIEKREINRKEVERFHRMIQESREVTGLYISMLKKGKYNYAPINSAHSMVQDIRRNFKQELMRVYRERTFIDRTFWGKTISIELYNGTDSGHFLVLKDGLSQMRSKIVRLRQSAKYNEDEISKRPVGFYLKKYHDSALSRDKRPKTDGKYTGIEIECILPRGVDLAPLLPFSKWVNVGHDGSISHDSGEEGKEIRVCLEKSEIHTVIPALMKTLKSMGATVNRSCGLHVHLDRRHDKNPEIAFQKLVRSLGLLYTVVPKSRRKNQYCKRNRHGNFEVARHASRYKAINASAYDRYQTLEVRLFGGTLEEEKIMNWIDTLWAIVNGPVINRVPKNFDTARNYWTLSDNVVAWLKERQARFAELNQSAPMAESETEESQLIEDRREAERMERAEEASENSDCGECGNEDCDYCEANDLIREVA